MSKDYSDKEFKEIYSEVVENVKTLTTKWDPSISDESDPGVVILKAFSLFLDKINYKINYRNSQNSIREVTDIEEAKKIFYDLGYQMKRKKSATGNLSIKYIGDENGVGSIPMFTQFSNSTGSQNYTSIEEKNIGYLKTGLVKVQEGVPSRYTYNGTEIFSTEDLTTDLRLQLEGIDEISENGVVIISSSRIDEVIGTPDWLNTSDNYFTSVETKNIFSIGHNEEGIPYIQFYEESLQTLSSGVGIWIISSSGAAGNSPKNSITKITSEGISGNDFVISHSEFNNGQDEESISSARENYYKTNSINNTLISERDYSDVIPTITKPDLTKLVSKSLVTGVNGPHNFVEVLSELSNGNRAILVGLLVDFISTIFINTLKYSENYYESFEKLVDQETENLIRKSLYKSSVVSNDITLTNYNSDSPLGNLYNEYLFDIAKVDGTIIVNSDEDEVEIKKKIILAIFENFNSANLTEGKLIEESELSRVVEESLDDIISASFFYSHDSGHTLSKKIGSTSKVTKSSINSGRISNLSETPLTDEEKIDIQARSILRGNTALFEKDSFSIPIGGKVNIIEVPNSLSTIKVSEIGGEDYQIKSIVPSFSPLQKEEGKYGLRPNEVLQLYTKSKAETIAYGFGVSYRLLSDPYRVNDKGGLEIGKSALLAGSVISKDSQITLEKEITDQSYGDLKNSFSQVENVGYIYKAKNDYTVLNLVEVEKGTLATGSIISDGSNISISGDLSGHRLSDGSVYGFIIKNDELVRIPEEGNVRLVIRSGDDSSTDLYYTSGSYIKITGFSNPLCSNGVTGEPNTYVLAQEQIKILEEQKTSISGEYLATLVLNRKSRFLGIDEDIESTTFTFNKGNGIVLEEGEHLIYSDGLLLDFVDFGSGTYLYNPNTSSIRLKVIFEYPEDLTSILEKMEGELQIFNTEILSFTSNEDTYDGVKLENSLNDYTWKPVEESISINGVNYGKDYFYRSGLILNTDSNKIIRLLDGQKLTITLQTKEGTKSITVNGDTYLSFSSPVSIYPGLNSDFDLVKMSSFNINDYINNNLKFEQPKMDNGFKFIIKKSENTDSGSITIGSLNDKELESKKYLLRFISSSDSKFYITWSGEGSLKILNNSVTDNSTFTKGVNLVYLDNIETLTINANNLEENDSLQVNEFIKLSGFNESLTEGQLVYEKILDLTKTCGINFDFTYFPVSGIENPLNPISFYDEEHILNKNLLTVIDLKYLYDHLRIIKKITK